MEETQLSSEEIKRMVDSIKKPGLRFTVDLYLLDYIKHCLLEDDQLGGNIRKLTNVLNYVQDVDAKKDVQDVIDSLKCVQSEYNEYLEDVRILGEGAYPPARGVDAEATVN